MLDSDTLALHKGLQREVAWIHGKIEIYKELTTEFLPDPQQYYGAQPLLEVVYWLTFESICLSISRALDPPQTGTYENASLRNLLEKMKGQVSTSILADFESEPQEAEGLAQPYREWRNKWIGHNDLAAITKGHARPSISADQMTAISGHLAKAMNVLHSRVFSYDMDYNSGLMRGYIRILKRNLQWARKYAQSLATANPYQV